MMVLNRPAFWNSISFLLACISPLIEGKNSDTEIVSGQLIPPKFVNMKQKEIWSDG